MRDPPRAERSGGPAPAGGVDLTSPWLLVAVLALVAAAAFALRATPPDPSAPTLPVVGESDAPDAAPREVTLYVVEGGVARPVVRAVPWRGEPAADLQATLAALRSLLVREGPWPAALPAPRVYRIATADGVTAVLDLPAGAPSGLDVAAERTIIASVERTVAEAGVGAVRYLRGGAPVDAWLGRIATPATLDD